MSTPAISIVIPTAGRPEAAAATVRALLAQAPDGAEAIVATEAGDERSATSASDAGARTVTVAAGSGPAAARNAAIAAASADLCLLCDDDIRPAEGMVAAHLEFHDREPDPMAALMGLVVPAPPLDRSAFQRWLHRDGIQFGYGSLEPGPVKGRYLWVANASFKREGLAAVSGFDEQIGFGSEDADLGERFLAAGGRIFYDDRIVALHERPTTLPRTLARMRRIGAASSRHPERLKASTQPRPTGPAHRLVLGALGLADRAALLRGPLLPAAWRALCKQAYRESYWAESDQPAAGVAVGAGLARRLAARMARTDPSNAGAPD